MSSSENIAMMIKIEQLGLFKQFLDISFREASAYFDRYSIWQFIDDAYYGLHVQGPQATFDDICSYIRSIDSKTAV